MQRLELKNWRLEFLVLTRTLRCHLTWCLRKRFYCRTTGIMDMFTSLVSPPAAEDNKPKELIIVDDDDDEDDPSYEEYEDLDADSDGESDEEEETPVKSAGGKKDAHSFITRTKDMFTSLGIDLKGDKPVEVVPDERQTVHLSQAALADIKKVGSVPVTIYAKFETRKLAIGILSADKYPQLSFDLVFDKKFELSHNSKNGNVHIHGYKSVTTQRKDMFTSLGIELKGNEPVKVKPEDYQVVHLSHAALADIDKGGSVPVTLYARIGTLKLTIGFLSADKCPQIRFDMVFEREFELFHNSKNGNVHVTGYKSVVPNDFEEHSDISDDESVEEETLVKSARGNFATKTPEREHAKKAMIVYPSFYGQMICGCCPKVFNCQCRLDLHSKAKHSAKIVTPQKSDGKKSVGGHVATPLPTKNAPKKSDGQWRCRHCEKTFSCECALDAHTEAKHPKHSAEE